MKMVILFSSRIWLLTELPDTNSWRRGKKSLPGHVSVVTAPPITSAVVLHLPHHPCHFEIRPPGAASPALICSLHFALTAH
ncbi:hypothetical protein AMECASPLE_003857 [Ameca splendens]|uniref:Secreted protein n=1 Tax=Ameca splendens TaxID=208324 RepID=A0ABV0XZ30_9TELE